MINTVRAIRNAKNEDEAIDVLHAYEEQVRSQVKREVIARIAGHVTRLGANSVAAILERYLDEVTSLAVLGRPVSATRIPGIESLKTEV